MFSRAKLQAFLFFVFFPFSFMGSSAFAASYEVTGWAWGADNELNTRYCYTTPDNGITRFVADPLVDDVEMLTTDNTIPQCIGGGIGWISFSNKSDGSAITYGVLIDSVTGDFKGYAWSSNIGWVTFNALEMQKCSTNPGDTCPVPAPKANVNIQGGGTQIVTGWARACAVFVSGCSGALRPSLETGNWDGWISLSDGGAIYGWRLDTTTMTFLNIANSPFYRAAWGGNTSTILPPPPPIDKRAGLGWIANYGIVNLSSVTPVPSLTFIGDQTVVQSGNFSTLRWITNGDVTSCTASGDWSGAKDFSVGVWHSEDTALLTAPQTYNLQCTGSSGDTPLRTVYVDVTSVDSDAGCGVAAGTPSRVKPSKNLCDSGNAGPVTLDNSTNMWKWICNGINGGANASCEAPKIKFFNIIQF